MESLISGKDAWIAKSNGDDVEWKLHGLDWSILTDKEFMSWGNDRFLGDTKYLFRLKPKTVKLELELPKPFEPKQDEPYWYLTTSNSKGYDWNQFQSVMGDEFYCQFGVWRTEEEVKQVVDQLRKLRGKK